MYEEEVIVIGSPIGHAAREHRLGDLLLILLIDIGIVELVFQVICIFLFIIPIDSRTPACHIHHQRLEV